MSNRSLKYNALLNSLRQVCAVIFPLITFPYVSRVLGAEGYGKINFSASVVMYFTLLAALGIQNYAVREGARLRQEKEKFQYFASEIFTINVYTMIIAYVLLWGLWMVWPKLHNYTVLIIIQSSVIICTTFGCEWVNIIYEDYQYITIRYLVFQIIAIVSMFLFVKNEDDYVIYAFITSFAQAGAGLLNIFYIRRYAKIRLLLQKISLKRHLIPMLILFGNALAVNVYVNSDVTMLGIFLDNTQVGIYSFVVKIYTILKQLIAAVIAVTVPRIASYIGNDQKKQYNELLQMTLYATLTLVIPMFVGSFMIGDKVIQVIGGEQYLSGNQAFQVLCLALSFSAVAYFFTSCVLIPNRKDTLSLMSTIIGAVINVVLNLYFIPKWGILGAAMTTVIAEGLVCVFSIYVSRNLYKLSQIGKLVVAIGAGCIWIVVACFMVKKLIFNIGLNMVCSIVFSAWGYICCILGIKNPVSEAAWKMIKQKLQR